MISPVKRGLIHVVNWLYVWLPRFTGCHRLPERSFKWRSGLPFPVCARCTGELIGMLVAAATGWLGQPPLWALFVMLLPLIADGTIQRLTRYESTNLRRLITGLLFGYAFALLLVWSIAATWQLGVDFGRKLAAAQ